MSDNFGLRLGIEGEREFRDAIRDINQSFKVLASEMNLVSSQFDRNDKSVEALTARNKVLNREIDTQKDKISVLEKGLANAASSFGENDKRTQAWAVQLNNARAELNVMERELATSEAAVNDLGDGMSDSADDADNLGEGLDDSAAAADDAGGKFEKLDSIIKGIAAALGAAAVAAGAAALKLGKEVVQQFGELEQNLGGSEAVFQDYSDHMQKIGEDAYKNLGVSQSQYLATANKMGALFQGTGLDVQKSADMTEKAMQRAADMASVMGIDMQMALDSVTGAAKGNFTMMDNLGVSMNATSIEAYAVSKGLDFVWASASNAEKAEVAMQMFFEQTEQYAGNFARESTETITGSLGLLQSATQSLVAGLGNADADITNLTENLVDAFRSAVDNIVPIIENLVDALPEAVSTLTDGINDLLPNLVDTFTDLFREVLELLLRLIPELVPVVVKLVTTVVETIVMMLPELVSAGARMIAAIAEGLGEAVPLLQPLMAGIQLLMAALEPLIPTLVAVGASLGALFIGSKLVVIFSSLTSITAAFAGIAGIATAVTTAWNAAMAANPIGAVVVAVAALAAGIALLIGWMSQESDEQKALRESTEQLIEKHDALTESIENTKQAYEDRLTDIDNEAGAATNLIDKIAELSAIEEKSGNQKQQLTAYVDMFNEAMGESVLQYDAENDAMSQSIDSIYLLVAARQEEAKMQAAKERAVEIAKEQMAIEQELIGIADQRRALDDALKAGTIIWSTHVTEVNKLNAAEADYAKQLAEKDAQFKKTTDTVVACADAQAKANQKIAESSGDLVGELKDANAIQDDLARKRDAREKAATETMIKEASRQGMTLDEYTKKFEESQKKQEEALKDYTAAATNMFDKLDNSVKVTVNEMIANLEHNKKVVADWADNLVELGEKGVNQGIVERLKAAGPESAGATAALVKATDEQISKLNAVFESGSEEAIEAMLKNFGLPETVNSGADMVDKIATGMEKSDALNSSAQKLITDMKTTIKTTVQNSGFDEIGRMIVDGVYKGIQQRESWFRSQVRAFFKSIVTSVKSELGINSPSTVFAGIGSDMASGIGVGFVAQMNKVASDIQKSVPHSLDFDGMTGGIGAVGADGSRGGGNSSVYQTINVTSPKPLSERELAREFKNLSRKLALGVV